MAHLKEFAIILQSHNNVVLMLMQEKAYVIAMSYKCVYIEDLLSSIMSQLRHI